MYVLDTNTVIGLVGGDTSINSLIEKASYEGIGMVYSAVTLAELVSGVGKAEVSKYSIMHQSTIVTVTSEIAELAGQIQFTERSLGRKVKTPDALILATAIVLDATLITSDKGLFFGENYGINVRDPISGVSEMDLF